MTPQLRPAKIGSPPLQTKNFFNPLTINTAKNIKKKIRLREINSPLNAIREARRESKFSIVGIKDYKRKASIKSPTVKNKIFGGKTFIREDSRIASPKTIQK